MGKYAASEKQVEFIHKLVEARNLDVPLYGRYSSEHNGMVGTTETISDFFWSEHGHAMRTGEWDWRDAKNAIETLKSAPFKEVPAYEQTGQFTGTVGERGNWHVTVQSVSLVDSAYGVSNLIKMTVNVPGSPELAWFDRKMSDLHIGDELDITGTVKAHKTFRGVRSTTVIRVKYDILSIVDTAGESEA